MAGLRLRYLAARCLFLRLALQKAAKTARATTISGGASFFIGGRFERSGKSVAELAIFW